jgi:LysR family transcriptional regulator, nitrogen assimilation regulatory protein
MNLKQLEYFVSVAELGSFSKAAVVLDIAQPALSRQVRALEIDLRETLLLRNGRGVTLTQAGQRLFEHSVAILQQVAQAREDMGPPSAARSRCR